MSGSRDHSGGGGVCVCLFITDAHNPMGNTFSQLGFSRGFYNPTIPRECVWVSLWLCHGVVVQRGVCVMVSFGA